jgi:hypothetical protein
VSCSLSRRIHIFNCTSGNNASNPSRRA